MCQAQNSEPAEDNNGEADAVTVHDYALWSSKSNNAEAN